MTNNNTPYSHIIPATNVPVTVTINGQQKPSEVLAEMRKIVKQVAVRSTVTTSFANTQECLMEIFKKSTELGLTVGEITAKLGLCSILVGQYLRRMRDSGHIKCITLAFARKHPQFKDYRPELHATTKIWSI